MKNALFLKKYLGMGREMNIFLGQTEEKQKVKSVQELAEFVLDKVNDTEEMTEEDSAEMTARIIAKLEAGRKLSAEEMNFLRRTNPILYAPAVRVQRNSSGMQGVRRKLIRSCQRQCPVCQRMILTRSILLQQ